MNDKSHVKFLKLVTVSVVVSLFANTASASGGVQILNLAAADKAEKPICGKYNLQTAKIFLKENTNAPASGSLINIVDEQGNVITTKQVAVSQDGNLQISIIEAADQEAQDIEVVLRSGLGNGEYVNFETVTVKKSADSNVRNVNFSKALQPGTYQVAINCRKNNLVPLGFVAAGAGLGALIASSSSNGGNEIAIVPTKPEVPQVPNNNNSNGNNNSSNAPLPNNPKSASP
ncbi:MAG: hypothetical protein KBC84_09355 [Proteobacteria bacterium]|nr:hypothetical protein [Pseudomonadota bacterium]